MYDELIALLEAIDGIQFCEYEWATRPAGNHGTYRIDFDASTDSGDDHSQDRAIEGSVDLWTRGRCQDIAAAVEEALETVCGASWEKTVQEPDPETHLLRREYVFQMERE